MDIANNPCVADGLMQIAGVAEQDYPAGSLYMVALPIGNVADITLRALHVLSIADAVAAEDTRQTRKVLDRFGIRTHVFSVREHNEAAGAEKIIERLQSGERIAMVTDAGTPAVSDPGAKAVLAVSRAGLRVIPIPGACAAVTALSAAGLAPRGFMFVGFLPPNGKMRQKVLSVYANRTEPFVLYEAPHRILALARNLAAALDPGRRIVIARELTKRFETITSVTAGELPAWASSHEPRGEYVVLVDEQAGDAPAQLDEQTRRWLAAMAEELPASRAAAVAAKVTGLPRSALYDCLSARNG